MYEVEFHVDENRLTDAFTVARLPTSDINIAGINGKVFNAIGEAPATSMGFSPSYDAGARGPTPRVSAFQPIRITCTFPGYIVKGTGDASRYYLSDNETRFFERLAKLFARRSDLAPIITIGVTIRRLLEENETPTDVNTQSASNLYSAVTKYEKVLVFEAGGNNTSYTIGFDALTRPSETEVFNYGMADQG